MIESLYEKQINEIIKIEGEVVGFNTLLKMRGKDKKFNPSPASKALKKLNKKGEIMIDKTQDGRTRYRPLKPYFDKAYEKFTERLEPIKKTLNDPSLKPNEKLFMFGNYFQTTLQIYDNFRLMILAPDVYEVNSKIKSIIMLQQRLFKEMKEKMDKLSSTEKNYVLNRIYQEPKNLVSLKEYREITHKPTKQEKREARRRELEQQEELFQQEPFCEVCGHRSKNYKDSQKHMDRHVKNLEKDPLKSLHGFKGFYCERCGSFLGVGKELVKHKCKLVSKIHVM